MGRFSGLLGKDKEEAGRKKCLFPLFGGQCHYYSLTPLEVFDILPINLYIISIYHEYKCYINEFINII